MAKKLTRPRRAALQAVVNLGSRPRFVDVYAEVKRIRGYDLPDHAIIVTLNDLMELGLLERLRSKHHGRVKITKAGRQALAA